MGGHPYYLFYLSKTEYLENFIIMPSRTAAYRQRLADRGQKRLSAFLTPAAHEIFQALRARYPDLNTDTLLSRVLEGKIPLPGDGQTSPGDGGKRHRVTDGASPGDGGKRHRVTDGASPGDIPDNRSELAAIGHGWRQEGLAVSQIAERFNAMGWSPAKIPKLAGVKPRSDSPDRWTVKSMSQLLVRDYPIKTGGSDFLPYSE